MKQTVLIVEDDPIIAQDLAEILESIEYQVQHIVYNAADAMESISLNTPDLILLDIQLEGAIDGIDLAHIINKRHHVPFIYITSFHDEQMIKRVSETKPAGFILKPFNENEVKVAIQLAFQSNSNNDNLQRNQEEDTQLFIKDNRELKPINLSDILHLKSDDNYCHIYLEDCKYMILMKLKDFLRRYSAHGFFQVHRSHIVNIRKISSVQDDYIYLGKDCIPMSKHYKKEFFDQLALL